MHLKSKTRTWKRSVTKPELESIYGECTAMGGGGAVVVCQTGLELEIVKGTYFKASEQVYGRPIYAYEQADPGMGLSGPGLFPFWQLNHANWAYFGATLVNFDTWPLFCKSLIRWWWMLWNWRASWRPSSIPVSNEYLFACLRLVTFLWDRQRRCLRACNLLWTSWKYVVCAFQL